MKADILRRAEEASYEDDEEENKEGGRDVAYDDDLDEDSGIKVRDGEASDDDTEGEDGGTEDQPACIFPYIPGPPLCLLILAVHTGYSSCSRNSSGAGLHR